MFCDAYLFLSEYHIYFLDKQFTDSLVETWRDLFSRKYQAQIPPNITFVCKHCVNDVISELLSSNQSQAHDNYQLSMSLESEAWTKLAFMALKHNSPKETISMLLEFLPKSAKLNDSFYCWCVVKAWRLKNEFSDFN